MPSGPSRTPSRPSGGSNAWATSDYWPTCSTPRLQIALAQDTAEQAADLAREAQALAERTGNRKASMSAGRSLAKAQRAGGQLAEAIETLTATAEVAREAGRSAQLRDVLSDWADALAATGDLEGAYRLTREALELSRR